MLLREKQALFVRLVSKLIEHTYSSGYEMTFGEAWRPPETAALYAAQGKGIAGSLHTSRLAVDLNLFKDGKYLASTEAHRPLGEWWEAQHELCRWGGGVGGGNHYALTHGGK